MTRTAGLGPLPTLLEQRAGERALHRVFAAEGVPLQVVDHPEAMMPTGRLAALFERAARSAGDDFFGFEVGEAMSLSDFGIWGEYCASGPTLGEALQRTVVTQNYHQPGAHISLTRKGDLAVWRYAPPFAQPHIHHADHIVGPFWRFVRAACGPDWMPLRIEMSYPRDHRFRQIEDRLSCPVDFGKAAVGFVFDARFLDRPNRWIERAPRIVTLSDVAARAATPVDGKSAEAVLSLILLRLLDGECDIEGTAQMAGLGVQTLQRRLRADGVGYRELVDIARSVRARALLRESTLSILEIALSLGYSDYANFARAFRRWTGRTPSAFRQAVNPPIAAVPALPADPPMTATG